MWTDSEMAAYTGWVQVFGAGRVPVADVLPRIRAFGPRSDWQVDLASLPSPLSVGHYLRRWPRVFHKGSDGTRRYWRVAESPRAMRGDPRLETSEVY